MVNQVRSGDCLPFLGAGACSGTIPNARDLSRRYADQYGYPFDDDMDLARVMQYALTEIRDPVDLKVELCRFFGMCGYPPSTDLAEPHSLLASLPISTFLTTNYDDFLAVALRRVGKRPQVELSRWWDILNHPVDPPLEATVESPLVYHLHGNCRNPLSMVLTESDYLTYMVNIVEFPASTGRSLLPPVVLEAMSNKPLLFIGYSLQDWTFRVLFHGLARTTPRQNQRRHVSVQLMPRVNGGARDAEQKARRYLEHYLNGWNISIFLGSASDFCAQLRARLDAAS
ncbi:hypothetical protein GCM10023193_68120 [Planotetraspora kaengkrachanensis]|uniref:SIR2-like domain-containing protein n=1 Tax=Planotetraspora kaengkrachanensis TaxID=575193 RepID=A0A8J3PYF1_9ACTN|nr:hypothetical protein Pka01_64440 [Planotetraspora kaengkrachanensis]